MTFALGPIANAQGEFKKRIKGTFENNIYTSPEKDFQIHAPRLTFEKWVSDEASGRAAGGTLVSFGDIAGFDYSVLSYPASQDLTVEEALLFSGVVHDKQVVQAAHGREWRVLSRFPGGSNTEEFNAGARKRLDLVAASAIFTANSRTYHVSAGLPLMSVTSFEERAKMVRHHLEEFLAGFQALNNPASDGKAPNVSIKQEIHGTLRNDVYTSASKDYRVRAPRPFRLGMKVRDENEADACEVIFSDDFGGFYRVLSFGMANGVTLEKSLRALKGPIEQKEMQTDRGKEFRVINVERAGAEVGVKIADAPPNSKAGTPDLVTANAAFVANGRIYHVVAGAVSFDSSGTEAAAEVARRRLEKFLAGFEALQSAK